MNVAIHSIRGTRWQGTAEKLICRTPQGQITVLDHHIPMITRLEGPDLRIVDKNNESVTISLISGFLEVRPDSDARILAEQ
ncbi:MAG: hypothetical protein A3J10_01080 [Candidatus Sungbacteria bacterium RIFCSPLOWO2_02_FULL_54_10]|uniref:ATP synthase F1 complex delta/epsilon subunit N-terminal domain-containing protein n=2 Tax=Candidatus Sungiibacteriota TaxID=1817917 RepID=A0A1G2L9B0_9BACT|nr:MAG: hypothetical protein A2679_00605 [Candidatus Sungbacteria bacterium RIFCSPHIGHO2_01_FULL_54_26]OHA04121.1 MAG: hypothetical protein A3C92_04115 [Candidatus Sungbacteria bacterium RIFCSPHIGHO2_02_FULL_53_17]OHA07369.1 MAG: hypothetical protein A3B34_02855 [Candidatus Sungbacteria bacterium RIFCSPLOWO2_01_FULL_54_21]OHA12709.1 MAG: hypothetical protein A3J10_01080 [Candidatus Sungbacteria bacterium RIFCSPLOWO2_02_FULL_54_10]